METSLGKDWISLASSAKEAGWFRISNRNGRPRTGSVNGEIRISAVYTSPNATTPNLLRRKIPTLETAASAATVHKADPPAK